MRLSAKAMLILYQMRRRTNGVISTIFKFVINLKHKCTRACSLVKFVKLEVFLQKGTITFIKKDRKNKIKRNIKILPETPICKLMNQKTHREYQAVTTP
jgi:hypothetical protein